MPSAKHRAAHLLRAFVDVVHGCSLMTYTMNARPRGAWPTTRDAAIRIGCYFFSVATAAAATGPHFLISACTNAVNCSGDMSSVSMVSLASRACISRQLQHRADVAVEPLHDFSRQAGRTGNRPPRRGRQLVVAEVFERRHVGEVGLAPARRHRERNNHAGLHLGARRGPGHGAEPDVAGDEILRRLRAATIRDVLEPDVFTLRQIFRMDVAERADAGGDVADRILGGLAEREQVLERVDLERSVRGQHDRRAAEIGDVGEVLEPIVIRLGARSQARSRAREYRRAAASCRRRRRARPRRSRSCRRRQRGSRPPRSASGCRRDGRRRGDRAGRRCRRPATGPPA